MSLAIIQVGHDPASDIYIRNKKRAMERNDFSVHVVHLPKEATTEQVIERVTIEASRERITAIMVQLPLPAHIDKRKVMESIPPDVDIDGLNPFSWYQPLTPCAIMRWLKIHEIPLDGKDVTILGRSDLVGKPLAIMLMEAGATVTVCNSHTRAWSELSAIRNADILISAVGKPNTVSIVPPNAEAIIDVGINRDEHGKLCGDVSGFVRKQLEDTKVLISPVPGGVGRWTVEELLIRYKEMEEEKYGRVDF